MRVLHALLRLKVATGEESAIKEIDMMKLAIDDRFFECKIGLMVVVGLGVMRLRVIRMVPSGNQSVQNRLDPRFRRAKPSSEVLSRNACLRN